MNEFEDDKYNEDPEHDMLGDHDYEINNDEDVTYNAFGNFDGEEYVQSENEIVENRINRNGGMKSRIILRFVFPILVLSAVVAF